MAWFRKAVSSMINITWTPRQAEFQRLEDSKFPDAHVRSYLVEVRDFIPEDYHEKVFLCGGFGASFVGLTEDFGDIDIFCNSKKAFDELLALLQRDSENEQVAAMVDRPDYGRLWKFKRAGQRFDLVEVSPMAGDNVNIPAILASFDISWCMAGVSLGEITEAWFHPDAFSDEVKVCGDNVKHIDATQTRVKKYADRVKSANHVHATTVIAALNNVHDAIAPNSPSPRWDS